MMMYEAARAKRKVAEFISSSGAEMEATNTTAPITAAAAKTVVVPCFTVNVVLLTPVTASLNVTVGRMLVATPVAPGAGF